MPAGPFVSATMHLSGLFIHPVKSLRGCPVTTADVDALGLVGDRRFLVVDGAGRFLTQRTLPRMALITASITTTTLTLSAEKMGDVSVPLRGAPGAAPLRPVTVWKSEGLQAEDCGDAAAAWLAAFLGVACRLVRIGARFHRPMSKPAARPGDVIAFQDAYPFLVIGEASLARLNDRLVARGCEPLEMTRFRPTIVIADCAPHAEDTWTRIRIGGIVLRAGGPCVRCSMTTVDPLTAERSSEPLSELATYRRDPADPGKVIFGQNFIHETRSGTLRVGDPAEVL